MSIGLALHYGCCSVAERGGAGTLDCNRNQRKLRVGVIQSGQKEGKRSHNVGGGRPFLLGIPCDLDGGVYYLSRCTAHAHGGEGEAAAAKEANLGRKDQGVGKTAERA